MNLRHPLPLDKIALLLVINYEYLKNLNGREDFQQEWRDLDNALDGTPRRPQGKRLRFYVIGDNRYHNEGWPGLLPKFTERSDVEVDPSLKDFI